MHTEPTLLYALKKLYERSSSEYWPIEQEIARRAIEAAEQEVAPATAQAATGWDSADPSIRQQP